MKKIFGIAFIFAVGAFLGYLYSGSRENSAKEQLNEITDSDHNNKLSKQDSALEQNADQKEASASGIPAAKKTEDKNEGLPKAPKLTPEVKPTIGVIAPKQKRNESKQGASLGANSSYTIVVPGLTGTVKLAGTRPKPQTFRMTSECRRENGDTDVASDSVLVSDNGGVANVFVIIREGLDPRTEYPVPTEPVVLDQSGCTYTPHVYAVRVGQPFQMLNSDPFLHNVNGMPKLNAKFNSGMPTKGSRIEKKFTKAEDAFRIKCDVHPWMSAYVWVVDHPYFAFTDVNGKFNIPKPPYGEYLVQVQHEKLGTKEKRITWGPDSPPIDFQF